MYTDDIPVKPAGGRGETAVGHYANLNGDVGGAAITHKSSAEMQRAALVYEEDNPRIEELRGDQGRALKGKLKLWCHSRDIIYGPNPPFAKHLNAAEGSWSCVKPKMQRILNRKKGRPFKNCWPTVYTHVTVMQRLYNGSTRRRRGAATEESMKKRIAQYGTRITCKNEDVTQETFASQGIDGVYLWPVRNGIAYAQIEKSADGELRLGAVMTSRNATIHHGEFAFPDATTVSNEVVFGDDEEKEWPEHDEASGYSERDMYVYGDRRNEDGDYVDSDAEEGEWISAGPARVAAASGKKTPVPGATLNTAPQQDAPATRNGPAKAKRGRGRPKKTVVEIDSGEVQNCTIQRWLIEKAVEENQQEVETEARTYAADCQEVARLYNCAETGFDDQGAVKTVVIDNVEVQEVYRPSEVNVIEACTKKEAFSDKEWFGTGFTYKEVFTPADNKEQQEVFEATNSFKWLLAMPLKELKQLVRAGKIDEPTLLRFHQVFCTKGVETVTPRKNGESKEDYRKRLKDLKAKVRTVVGREQWLLSGQKTDGRLPGEVFISRCPTPMTQKIVICTAVGQQKEVLQDDEVGMFPWAKNKGPDTWGIPPKQYWPEEIVAKWAALGYTVEDLVVP